MLNRFKHNIENDTFKKVSIVVSLLLITSLSATIVFNTYDLSAHSDLSISQKILKHYLNDHKVNESVFDNFEFTFKYCCFVEINTDYMLSNTDNKINCFVNPFNHKFFRLKHLSFFLGENLLVSHGFKSTLFKPPKLA